MKNLMLIFLGVTFFAPMTLAQQRNYRSGDRLTGTWRLNASQSDDPRTIAERAFATERDNRNNNAQDNLVRRLEAPDELLLERRGQTVTMSSNRGQQVTFDADGRETTESLRNGRQRTTRASLSGDRLIVRTNGDRGSDYEVTFEPLNGGRSLRVTRSLYTDRLNQRVVSRSVYDRISDRAQFDGNSRGIGYNESRNTRRGDFLISDGTQLFATLNQDLRTKDAQAGDMFTMTVRDPNAYSGAILEGRIVNAERSGRVSGRAGFQLQFDRIRLRNGQSSEFSGTIENVRLPNGENVRIDQEGGVAEDQSQTNRTVQRSAIGGAIGAIIGAIAGGGKGAAIGAATGAGVGAGSIYVQGRDDLELTRGSEFTIRANAPR